MTIQADPPVTRYEILETARQQVLEEGVGLSESQLVDILRLPDEALPAALQLAHEVRLKHCGEDVEVEGIISIKTGGCPEDCHFCSQSGHVAIFVGNGKALSGGMNGVNETIVHPLSWLTATGPVTFVRPGA